MYYIANVIHGLRSTTTMNEVITDKRKPADKTNIFANLSEVEYTNEYIFTFL